MKTRYELQKQETSYYCAVACLQAILRCHDISLSQKDIAEKVPCFNKSGSKTEKIAEFVKLQGS
jgi:ABC-type bacteriocin/lantibiotic exporter with double-glycine peptidase domain